MDKPLGASFCLLLLFSAPAVLATSQHSPATELRPAFFQMKSAQVEQDSDILFYISDDDRQQQVAVDFNDTVDYARSSILVTPEDQDEEQLFSRSNPYMTGDTFDNGLSDETKLYINSVQAPVLPVRLDDQDDSVVSIPEEPPDTDEDVEAVDAVFADMVGDLDDSRWNPVTPLSIATQTPDPNELAWGNYITVLDPDEWSTSEVDTNVYIDNSGKVPIPAQVVPTREFVYDLDEEQVNVAGIRLVLRDVDDIPLLYSNDSIRQMVGDMYDNQRTDQRSLIIREQSAGNPLLWTLVRAPEPVAEPETAIEDNDEAVFEVQERLDIDDLQEVDTIFKPADVDILLDSDTGGDLDELAAYDNSTYMVGDLFDNLRTDQSKLTIVEGAAEDRLTWGNDQDEFIPDVPEPPVSPVPEPLSEDLDDMKNLFVTEPEVYADVEEIVVPEVMEAEEVFYDTDETDDLTFGAPENYMSGDLFNNRRTDSSMLRVNRFQGNQISWPELDTDDDKTVFDLEPGTPPQPDTSSLNNLLIEDTYEVVYQKPSDQDDLSTQESQAVSQIEENEDVETEMTQASLVAGDRLSFYDADDVPTFFSTDPADYLSGDLFNNQRSDGSRLTLVLQSGLSASWTDIPDADDTQNPSFLP